MYIHKNIFIYILMKSVIVYQLPLPTDVIEQLCSFLYYRVEETISRNKTKYNRVICDLFYTVRLERGSNYYTWNYSLNQMYTTLIIYNVQSTFDIRFYMCKCGNYTRPTIICKCKKLKYVI
jgi:hypothetical protein